MRWLLGCLGLVFVIFGGCVLAIFADGVAPDEVAFAIGAFLVLVFGVWLIYRAVRRPRTPAGES